MKFKLKTIVYVCVLDNEVSSDLDAVTDEYGATIEVKPFVQATNQNRLTENNSVLGTTTGIPYTPTPKSRMKRSLSSENIVELMVVADKKMAEYHGDELHNYILTLMSIVRVIKINISNQNVELGMIFEFGIFRGFFYRGYWIFISKTIEMILEK